MLTYLPGKAQAVVEEIKKNGGDAIAVGGDGQSESCFFKQHTAVPDVTTMHAVTDATFPKRLIKATVE